MDKIHDIFRGVARTSDTPFADIFKWNVMHVAGDIDTRKQERSFDETSLDLDEDDPWCTVPTMYLIERYIPGGEQRKITGNLSHHRKDESLAANTIDASVHFVLERTSGMDPSFP